MLHHFFPHNIVQNSPFDILMLFLKISQVKCYSFLIYLIIPPPHISDYQRVFLLLFEMPLGYLNGWFAIIQKFPQDSISSWIIKPYRARTDFRRQVYVKSYQCFKGQPCLLKLIDCRPKSFRYIHKMLSTFCDGP